MAEPSRETPPDPAAATGAASSVGAPMAQFWPTSALAEARRIRLALKALLVTQRTGWVIAGFVAALFSGALLDFVFRAPGWVRLAGLALALGVLVVMVRRRVVPALRFAPGLEDVALRLARPSDRYELPAAMALSTDPTLPPRARSLAGLVLTSVAGSGWAGAGGLLRWQSAARSLGAFLLAGATVAAMFVASPGLAWIGTRRMLLPWTEASWPRRYHIEPIAQAGVAPLGQAVLLQGALVRSPGELATTEVRAEVTITGASGKAVSRTVVLTPQQRTLQVDYLDELEARRSSPAIVFERLLEPGALDLTQLADAEATLSYRLIAGDHSTAPLVQKLRRPPEVARLTVEHTPPLYMQGRPVLGGPHTQGEGLGQVQGQGQTQPQAQTFTKPTGTVISRAIAEGSVTKVTLSLSRPLPLPAGDELAVVLGEQLAALAADGKATLTASGSDWNIQWTLLRPLAMPIRLTDADGLRSGEDVGLRIEFSADRPPEVVIRTPATDQIVTPQAEVPLLAEARDDVGLVGLLLEGQRAARPGDSAGAAHEPASPAVEIARRGEIPLKLANGNSASTAAASNTGSAAAEPWTVAAQLTPSALGAKPGDELWLTAIAQDNYLVEGTRHEPVRSTLRKLRIVSTEQLAERLSAELAALRRSVIAVAERQDQVRRSLQQAAQAAAAADAAQAASPGDEGAAKEAREAKAKAQQATQQEAIAQAELSRQIQRLGEQADQVAKSSRQNKLDPSGKSQQEQSADRAAEALADALAQSNSAAISASDSASNQAKPSSPEASAQAQSQAKQADASQQQTQRSLEQAAAALDRGSDAWASRRALQDLADRQRAIREATAKATRETEGKQASELSAQQRAAVQQAADQQDELARRTAELQQRLEQQAEALKQSDPGTSESLKDVANRAKQADLANKMAQSAQAVRDNQGGQAQTEQKRSEETLRSMLDQLDQAKANRDAVLRRQLDSLTQSIDALIKQQEGELKRLADASAASRFDGLDQGMIRLHAATLGTLDKAQEAEGGRKAAELLKAAADAQVSAVGSLRAKPPAAENAKRAEEQALRSLKDARAAADAAQKEASEREQVERRRILREAYMQILEDQRALTADTTPLIGKPVDRRSRNTALQLATRQDLIGPRLDDLKEKLDELAESGIFQLAHQRIKSAAGVASELLKAGKWNARLTSQETSIERTLSALIDALAEPKKDEQFRENEQPEQDGGQGGQGGNQPEPALPPIVELELLKRLQTEALRVTRESAETADAGSAKLAADDAAKLQTELSKRAKEIAEKLEKKQ